MNGSSPGMDGARLCCAWPENKSITACTSKLSRTFVASRRIAIHMSYCGSQYYSRRIMDTAVIVALIGICGTLIASVIE